MNALLLPGNSPRHKVWIEDLKTAVEPSFGATKTQHYRHWETGDEWANVDQEISLAKERVQKLAPYVIIAKSIGTTIATKATATGQLSPEKLILLGIPINGGAEPTLFAEWLKQVTIPVVIVQNTNDPLGSFKDISRHFKNISDTITIHELPGDTHDYLDFATITKLI